MIKHMDDVLAIGGFVAACVGAWFIAPAGPVVLIGLGACFIGVIRQRPRGR